VSKKNWARAHKTVKRAARRDEVGSRCASEKVYCLLARVQHQLDHRVWNAKGPGRKSFSALSRPSNDGRRGILREVSNRR
jgi:hypothetical protein